MVKGNRFLSILATVVILAMLIAAIPANLCFAATGDEHISLSPSSGAIDDDIDINGTYFEDGEEVYFYFSSDSGGSDGDEIDTLNAYEFLDSETADSSEDVSISFTVPDELTDGDDAPEDVEDGTYYVYATYDDDEIVAKRSFTVSSGGGTGDESIRIIQSSAGIDDYVEITGEDFEENERVYFYFSKESAGVGDEIDSDVENYERVAQADADNSGIVEAHFDVPDELTDGADDEAVVGGTYYVYAAYYGDKEIVAKDSITITATQVSLNPTKGTVGTKVTITGSGFDKYESIDITFGSTPVDIDSGDDETRSTGSFTSYFLVPKAAKGKHTVTVEISGDEGEADFTVEPDIEIDPEDGGINEQVTVTGTGFAKNGDISITFDGVQVATGDADSYGSFKATFNVPEVTPGTYEIKADTAKASFTISTEVTISPTTSVNSPGNVGDEMTISGTGFKSNSEITITYESTPVEVATVTSEADGSFEATFKIPPSDESGEHTVTASDGVSSMSVKFYLESTPPEVPQPLLPYMEGKAKSLAHFDWEDVTADVNDVVEQSLPITYDLQVATDDSFTNKVVNKTGIETSEYTLTEEEALEKTSEEFPYYYWRIRAVDAASNASAWTGAGIFTLGFSFDFDLGGWLLYVLIGVGALLLFFVGFWLGRRGGGGDYY
jgi:hypothetical protein